MSTSVVVPYRLSSLINYGVMSAASYKVTLHTVSYTPSAIAHAAYADLTNELPTANGYTAGGATLSSVTWTRSGNVTKLDAADVSWSASGGNIAACYAVVRAVGTFDSVVDPILSIHCLDNTPANKTASDGYTFEVVWASTGIATVTVPA